MDHLHEACGSVDFSSNVCFTVASDTILSSSAMLELFLTFNVLVVSVVLEVLPRKCKGTVNTFEGKGGGSRMRRYIRCELFRQIYSVSLMLWSSDQILTIFNRCRLCLFIRCQFNSRPVGILSESTTGFNLVLRDPSNDLSSLLIFDCVLRCVAVPVSGSHLPFIRIFMTVPLLTMTLYGPS